MIITTRCHQSCTCTLSLLAPPPLTLSLLALIFPIPTSLTFPSHFLPTHLPLSLLAPSARVTANPERFVNIGSNVSLTCSSNGSNGNIIWKRALSPEFTQPQLIHSSRTQIPSFGLDDRGAYYCLVENELGTVVSEPVVLVASHNSTMNMDSEYKL